MKKLSFLISILISVSAITIAQNVTLEKYIQMGLDRNLILLQKEFSLKKSLSALDEARGLFLPSVDVNARYTRAAGGRTIEFPVGDLMNPVYSTLNQLTGQNLFPTDLQNESIKFLREEEHETKIGLVQPIFNTQIFYNYRLKENLSEIEKNEREVYVRTLIKDIKSAYFNYLITINVEKLALSTEEILRENLRVNKSLFENDKVTIDAVYRSETELSELLQNKEEALNDKLLAAAYFNFLLNLPLDKEIIVDESFPPETRVYISVTEAENLAVQKREELMQLEFAKEAAENSIGLSKSGYFPNLLLAANYGFQGEKYRFTGEDDFWNASLVLQWNLFKGFQDKAKIEQAEWEKERIKLQRIESENKIRLQVREVYNNLEVSLKAIETATLRQKSANKSFEIIDKKYREGMASLIEFIDARSTKTRAQLNYILTKYDYQIKRAELERVLAANELY